MFMVLSSGTYRIIHQQDRPVDQLLIALAHQQFIAYCHLNLGGPTLGTLTLVPDVSVICMCTYLIDTRSGACVLLSLLVLLSSNSKPSASGRRPLHLHALFLYLQGSGLHAAAVTCDFRPYVQ